MDSFDILVIFLSTALAIFLVISIIFGIYLVKIARQVNEIAEKARNAADSVETAARVFGKTAAPAAFTKIVANIVESFSEKRKGKK